MNRNYVSFILTLSAVLCFGGYASADWSYDFNDPSQLNEWLLGNVTGGGPPSPTFSASTTNDQLLMTDTVTAAAGGAGAGFGLVPDALDDQLMTGIINPNGDAGISPTVALLARGNFGLFSFYAAEVDYSLSKLIIFRNDGPSSTTDLVDAVIPNLTTADSLYLEFQLNGAELAARVYDAPGGSQLAQVSVNDATYAAGVSGVLVNADNPTVPVLGVWDDVSATTIPEPTSIVLLLGASLALVAARRYHN